MIYVRISDKISLLLICTNHFWIGLHKDLFCHYFYRDTVIRVILLFVRDSLGVVSQWLTVPATLSSNMHQNLGVGHFFLRNAFQREFQYEEQFRDDDDYFDMENLQSDGQVNLLRNFNCSFNYSLNIIALYSFEIDRNAANSLIISCRKIPS